MVMKDERRNEKHRSNSAHLGVTVKMEKRNELMFVYTSKIYRNNEPRSLNLLKKKHLNKEKHQMYTRPPGSHSV